MLGAGGGPLHPEACPSTLDVYSSTPSVFNFYNYLRTHPLLLRQQLAATSSRAGGHGEPLMLAGFAHGKLGNTAAVASIDKITPVERRLYFTTAHAHFKSGCPMLALEVLSKLPEVIDLESDITKSHSGGSMAGESALIQTGTLDAPTPAKTIDLLDKLVLNGGLKTGTDWTKPVDNGSANFYWSQLVTKVEDELKLDWSDENEDDAEEDSSSIGANTKSDNDAEDNVGISMKSQQHEEDREEESASKDNTAKQENKAGDIMAQQLKFMACLKVMMEELATLATGFEVDGGQLRFQLYIWLEKEVQVLRQLTNYGQDDIDGEGADSGEATDSIPTGDAAPRPPDYKRSSSFDPSSSTPTLHEVILAERLDFDAKLARAARRKKWLQAHQQLLRTLLGYCILHGAVGGLASVRMELILLLQELQQEKTQQQLLSPLPFPTTLPLLSASVASSKTVIADPIRHLQSLTQDLLHSVLEFSTPPTLHGPLGRVLTMRNLSAALAACIYQSLCDSDSFVVAISDTVDCGMEGFTSTNVVYKDSYLMAGAKRRRQTSSGQEVPNSPATKWPGVSSLRAILSRDKDEAAPRLPVLLCEALVGVYMSLLIHGLATYDANLLYRLMAHTWRESMWPALFGGGLKKPVHVLTQEQSFPQFSGPSDDISRQRLKLHMKVMGVAGSPGRLMSHEERPAYKEKFIPPDLSMLTYFMTKPYENPNDEHVDYDSSQSVSSSEDEEDDDPITSKATDVGMREHIDPSSYSWCLLRYVMVHRVRTALVAFLPQIGIELPELPVCSPLVQATLKTLEAWQEQMHARLELFSGPPPDYIPGCFPDASAAQLANKYRALLQPSNTPFQSSHSSALPAKRLWHYLVKQECLQHIFIKYVVGRKRLPQHLQDERLRTEAVDGAHPPVDEPMKILHKEQDAVAAFCINQNRGSWKLQSDLKPKHPHMANLHCIAVATPKEVIEMDITHLLKPPTWLEDETEYDIECLSKPATSSEAEDFQVVHAPQDRTLGLPPTAPGVMPLPTNAHVAGHSGRGAGLLTKRKSEDVRRMSAHPHLPYYLTGAQDGCVKLWEWCHTQPIAQARPPGSFPKVTRVLFNAQGNKFGVSDGEGSLSLWQVGLGVSISSPYLNLKCHNKSTNDFTFVGSSSLIATAGHASESKNVCLWDTLLPQRSCLVQAFYCHQDGSPALVFAPQHKLLISAGRRGDVSLFDVRQRQLRHQFQAHDAAIRCIALHPSEQFFVTGAADGDIKVWSLGVHNLVYSFPGEHMKGSLFRNVGTGVAQVYLSAEGHLFSCGGDGSLKVRYLPQQFANILDCVSNLSSPDL